MNFQLMRGPFRVSQCAAGVSTPATIADATGSVRFTVECGPFAHEDNDRAAQLVEILNNPAPYFAHWLEREKAQERDPQRREWLGRLLGNVRKV